MAQVRCLRDECLTAFGKYAQEVQKTCELLGDLENSSAPLDQLLAILGQTQAEDQAQEVYLLLRQKLFEPLDTMDIHAEN